MISSSGLCWFLHMSHCNVQLSNPFWNWLERNMIALSRFSPMKQLSQVTSTLSRFSELSVLGINADRENSILNFTILLPAWIWFEVWAIRIWTRPCKSVTTGMQLGFNSECHIITSETYLSSIYLLVILERVSDWPAVLAVTPRRLSGLIIPERVGEVMWLYRGVGSKAAE